MTYTPTQINRFGGLNLAGDPTEVGAAAAVDLMDVKLYPDGRLTNRGGYTSFATGASSWQALAPGSTATGAAVFAHQGNTTTAYDSSGVVIDTIADPFRSSTVHGTPTQSRVYFMSSLATDPFYFDGTNFVAWPTTTVNGVAAQPTPEGQVLGVTPKSNRLVIGAGLSSTSGPDGSTSSDHHLHFSDAGNPDSWTINNFVQLSPGDGEMIHAIAVYRDRMFVFKNTKFYVFHSESTDGTGEPIFNYYEINVGLGVSAEDHVCATPDGVAFIGHDGVYMTTGDVPTKLSGPLEPLWAGGFSSQSPFEVATSFFNLLYYKRGLYMTLTTDGDNITFVYDLDTRQWTVFSLDLSPGAGTLTGDYLFFSSSTAIYKMVADSTTYTTDNGTAINSHYQSGIYELGPPGAEAFTRWTRLVGSGSPTVSVFTDFESSDSRAAAVTLGTSPALAEGYHQQSYKGRVVSHKLSASGAFSVTRLQHDVAHVRP